MSPPRVEVQQPVFDERNRLIDFVVGLCAVARKVRPDALLQGAAPPGAEPSPTPRPGSDHLVDFVLGVASFTGRLEALVRTGGAAPPGSGTEPEPSRAPARALRDLLR